MPESRLLNELSTMRHGIIGICASGKQGKSALAHTIVNCVPNLASRPHYLYETPEVDLRMFPGYILTHDVDDIPPEAVVLIEDLGRIFHSRGSGNSTELPRWLGIISHKNIIVVFTIQNFSDADISLFRSQNFIELHKIMHDEDLSFEREEFRENQNVANIMIRRYALEHPDIPMASMVFSPRYSEVSAWPLVSWWTDECAHFLRDAKVGKASKRKEASS